MERGLTIATAIQHREYEVANRFALGILFAELFAADEAMEQLEGALGLARDLSSRTWTNIINGALASVYLMSDSHKEARSCLETAISPDSPMDTLGRRNCWVHLAELALAQDDPTLALDITDRLIASAPSMTPGRVITYLWKLKGEGLAALGRVEEAASLYQEAIENALETGERFLVWRIHTCLSRLYQTMGNHEAARKEFDLARGQVDELTATIPDEVLVEKFLQGASNILNTISHQVSPLEIKRGGQA
jgi:tetratricopeptide (TPR) repeat protein